jgi:hypothetical protein
MVYLRQRTGEAVDEDWRNAIDDQSYDFLARLLAMTGTWISLLIVSVLLHSVHYIEPHFQLLLRSDSTTLSQQQVYFGVTILCEFLAVFLVDLYLRRHRKRGESLWQLW